MKKDDKLYKIFNDLNLVNRKHINETCDAYKLRKAKEYARKNNIICGIKSTYTTGTRTYKNFGIFDYEAPKNNTYEETKKCDDVKTEKYMENYIELRLAQLNLK